MDSRAIVSALEDLQPEPSLHLDNGYVDRVHSATTKTVQALGPIVYNRVPGKVLNPVSAAYFRETRAKKFGIALEDLAKSDRAGENAWKAAEEPLSEVKAILHEHGEGPYIMGKQVSFADFVFAGLWRFFEVLDEDGDLSGRVMRFDESFPKHHEACKKWLERDDY